MGNSSGTKDPIVVSPTTLPTFVTTALRYVFVLIGTFAVAHGWVDAKDVDGIATAAATIATAGYGIWLAVHNRRNLITTAAAAPDDVAVVK